MNDHIFVIKHSGEQEEFSDKKVLASMERVGVPEDFRPQVLDHIKKRLHPGISTEEIFSHILEFLTERDQKASIRYNLKQAIFDLGPTGFPFERYMERIFESFGYETRVDIQMRGECVMHEIDIVLDKDGKREIVEVKFHNQQGIKTDVQVAMYTYARFLDVEKNNTVSGVWLVTNTKLSTDAIVYANCKGVKTIAWNYPSEASLQDFVERPEMYPVTILKSLSQAEKQKLLDQNIILCCDLLNTPEKKLQEELFLDPHNLKLALGDASIICHRHTH